MKQFSIIIFCVLIANMAMSQASGNFQRITVRDSLSLRGTWIKGVSNDTTMSAASDSYISTQLAVVKYIASLLKVSIDTISYDAGSSSFAVRKTDGSQYNITTGLVDSLAARLTAPQADVRYKPLSYAPDWVEIINKPGSFIPSTHTHPVSQITDFASAARALLTATAPISYNSSTGAIGWAGTTTDVPEGMRLYYSNSRVQSFADTRYTPLTRSLTTGTGMTGGGDFSADRLIGLDFSYLDDRYLSGYKQRAAVRVATTANISLTGTQTIDAVAVVAGDRILVKNQTTGSQNGIYIVATGAWSRAADFDAATPGEIEQGSQIFVQEGTSNNKTGWSLSTGGIITVGTTSLTFIQYAGANSYAAGTGLTLGGNTFSAQTSTALWNANKLQGVGLSTTAPASGQLLRYDGTNYAAWTPDFLTGELDMVAQGKTVSVSAGTGISVSGSTQSLGSNPAFAISLNATTSNVPEGSNMYWTNTRGDARYPLLSGSYNNPSWLTGLAYSKLTGTPTTLAGAGITDAIQAQNTSAQAASWNISGSATVAKNGSASFSSTLLLANAAQNRGVNFQLNEGTNPGIATWIHNGTSWLKRFEVFSDGAFQFPNVLSGNPTGITTTGVLNIGSIPAHGSAAANFLSYQNGGSVTYRTAAQVLSDIAAAPASGSNNYIRDNNTSAQTASAWTTGYLRSDNAFVGPMLNSGSSGGTVSIIGGNGTSNRGAEIGLRGSNYSTTPGEISFHTGTGTGTQPERMRITASGNVGIGTTTPSVALEVAGIIQGQRIQTVGTSQEMVRLLNDGAYMSFWNTSGTTRTGFIQGSTGNGITVATDLDLPVKLNTNSLERVRVIGNGNVGIGTASPSEKLDVSGNVRAYAFRGSGANDEQVRLENNTALVSFFETAGVNRSGYLRMATTHAALWYDRNSYMQFATNATERMRINANGDVGIGRTSSGNKLEVAGAVTATGDVGAAVANSVNVYVSSGGGNVSYVNASGALGAQILLNNDSIAFSSGRMRVVGRLVVGSAPDDAVNTIQASNGSIRSGGLVLGVKVITASYTATISDYTIINRATSGTPTLTLPSASSNAGRIYVIKDEAGTPNLLTFSPTIRYNGLNYTNLNYPAFSNGPRVTIQSDGTYWQVLTN